MVFLYQIHELPFSRSTSLSPPKYLEHCIEWEIRADQIITIIPDMIFFSLEELLVQLPLSSMLQLMLRDHVELAATYYKSL